MEKVEKYCIKNGKRQMKGSFTVEMAFLFPIILSIIFSLFYVIFYQCDKVRVEVVLYEQIREREQEVYKEKIGDKLTEVEKKSKKARDSIYEQGFYLLRKRKVVTEKNHIFIKQKIIMQGKCSITYLDRYLQSLGLMFQRSLIIPIYNPMEILRIENVLPEESDMDKKLDYGQKKIMQIKSILE